MVRTDLDRPSVVSVARQALPGWQVEVDGEAAEERIVDGLLLGVEVPAGEHVITWRYHSPWLVPTLDRVAARRRRDHCARPRWYGASPGRPSFK